MYDLSPDAKLHNYKGKDPWNGVWHNLTQQKRCLQLTRPHPKPRQFWFFFFFWFAFWSIVLIQNAKVKNPLRRRRCRAIASPANADADAVEASEVTRCGRCRCRCSIPPTPLSGRADTDADRQGVTAERRNPPKPAAPVVTSCDAQRALRSRDVFETSWIKHAGGRRPYRPDRLLSKAPALPTFISHLAEHKSAC